MGLKLSEYGLFRAGRRCSAWRARPKRRSTTRSGLDWIPPELRENCGEIEAAPEGRAAELVELRDIRGDCTCTRPRPTAARRSRRWRRRRASAATSTSPSPIIRRRWRWPTGWTRTRAVAFAEQVREINRDGLGIRIFSGLECDILRDGALDLADDALAELDFVIGSVHSHMNLEAAEMTDRLLRALECPPLRVLGHPTGRILLHRDPLPIRFRSRGEEAVERGRLAGNQCQPGAARPGRAADSSGQIKGAQFTISTDAHHPKHLGRTCAMASRWRGADGWGRRRDEYAARSWHNSAKRWPRSADDGCHDYVP